eukprot:TRINITY_DN30001_c0_g1_i1.p1 TRINITY_DN30001_c0_g1~~TRINITY_DN30001_c0_g1_i1.p1  ORF type:complete len:425 (+),score=131.80 TRINITY_DN30001_c0_g1_i1:70-1275(+)
MKAVRIVGIGSTGVGRLGKTATALANDAVNLALTDAGLSKTDLQGLVAVPSLSEPHFMQAHYLATHMKLLPSTKMVVRTIDTGGAGPISALNTGVNMIRQEWADVVCIVASDAVMSLPAEEFARRADASVSGNHTLESPCIPNGYDRIARWHMERYGVTREHLAMVPTLLSHFSAQHPDSMCKRPYQLEEVLNAPKVADVTTMWECARRADGAAAIILASERHMKRYFPGRKLSECPAYVSGGEASGPLYPPESEEINEDLFSCEKAARIAYKQGHLTYRDIDFWGLYDCFPICFIRALEAVKLCGRGEAGKYLEEKYTMLQRGTLTPSRFPINTHGGLQCFGAPWEVPAMYNILEAVRQLRGQAGDLQVAPKPRKALVYGNGGIFSASAVAILSDGIYDA